MLLVSIDAESYNFPAARHSLLLHPEQLLVVRHHHDHRGLRGHAAHHRAGQGEAQPGYHSNSKILLEGWENVNIFFYNR